MARIFYRGTIAVKDILPESALFDLVDKLPTVIDHDEYQRLTTIRMRPDGIEFIQKLDPFGTEYRTGVVGIYHRIAGRASYDAAQQELSGMGHVSDIWRMSSPFSFQSTKFVGEFLTSWGAIFDALDLRAGGSVLEYGPGSGQSLLMLARTGVKTFGVDIDASSLELLRRQSDTMGLGVSLEQAEFGEGFAGQRFDRILFFEAFHHALHFDDLLLKLHDRLSNADGRIVFCGEPIVPIADDCVPFPWGPRMDALSVLCMRRYGWMELGFQHDFFVRSLMRNGWVVEYRPSHIQRAATYIATPIGGEIPLGKKIELPAGWSVGEGGHRWTIAEDAVLPLPLRRFGHMTITLGLVNYLAEPKVVTLSAGQWRRSLTVQSGERCSVSIGCKLGDDLHIKVPLSSVPGESRKLGIAVTNATVVPGAGVA